MTSSWDTIVVGAGPAGCAAAIELARSGARVCVLDRARFPRAKTCGDAVSNRGAKIVDELTGIPGALATIPHAVFDRADAVLPGDHRIGREFGRDHGYIVPRVHLDRLLRDQLESEGVEVREGVRVRSLLLEGDKIVGAQAGGERLWAPAVVAADGPGSVGWAALGKPYERGRNLAVAITAYYEGISFHGLESTTEHYFEPGLRNGYAWIFPNVDGESNVGVYQRADAFEVGKRSLREWLDVFISRHPERFGGGRQVGKTRTWALPLAVRLRPPGGHGLLLAGDAAYSIDPLSGEGIWQALHTGRTAGRTIARALEADGLTKRWVGRYQRDWGIRIGGTSLLRLGVQEAMTQVVERGLHRNPLLRAVLARGYRSDTLEVSKRVTSSSAGRSGR